MKIELVREMIDMLTLEKYMKGFEFINWDYSSSYTYNFEIESDYVDNVIIINANVFENTLTLFTGDVLTGKPFKLFPLKRNGERASYHFTSKPNYDYKVVIKETEPWFAPAGFNRGKLK